MLDAWRQRCGSNVLTSMCFSTFVVLSCVGLVAIRDDDEGVGRLRRLMGRAGLCYFVYDSAFELLVMARWLYVPHHLVGMLIFYYIGFGELLPGKLLPYAAILGFAEATTLLINARDICKRRRVLSGGLDLAFLLVYVAIRCAVLPYLIRAHIAELHMAVASWIVIAMSAWWAVQWSSGWYRRHVARPAKGKAP